MQKMLLIIMSRSKRPVILTAGKFFTLSIDTLTLVNIDLFVNVNLPEFFKLFYIHGGKIKGYAVAKSIVMERIFPSTLV